MKAFEAARDDAFTLLIDCPVRLHSGLAADRSIFIDHNTTVQFSGSGKFVIDNLFHPAFVIANSSDIKLINWNVEWVGSMPVNPDVGGYILGGKFVASSGQTQPAGAFNDLVLTPWLETNRDIKFDETRGYVKPIWVGAVNTSAVFYITGNSANVVFTGLNLYVASSAGGSKFIPMAFSLSENWKSRQTVSGRTPITAQYVAMPHGLTFSGVTLDGTLMGWQGNARDVMFEHITSRRYSDLQDSGGKNVGGIKKWFPPPHLFYLNYGYDGDSKLFNANIHIDGVQDLGPRIGVARDKGGSDTVSGYALSLKLGCEDCSVDNYKSTRPDGFMDVLPSNNLTVSNVYASFDSEFIHDTFPPGIRFPSTGYTHVKFQDIQLVDTAASTLRGAVGHAVSPTNVGIVFSNVQMQMNRWAGSDLPLPVIGGRSNNVSLDMDMSAQSTQVSHLLYGSVASTLKATPTTVHAGGSTILTWSSAGARSCTASGAWSGAVPARGSRVVKVGSADNYDFNLSCKNSTQSSRASLRVDIQ